MADSQKIHPVQDPEAPQEQRPTAPLVPRGSSRSDNGNPEQQHYPPPPPIRRARPYEKPPPKRSCCRKCLCWTLCLILLLIIILGILAAIIYFVFQPKVPKYSVDSMRITQFNLGNDMILSATFNVNITARNPNKKIGIYYEGGSHLSVWFTGTKLCEGSLPKFYQGHRNTTVLNLTLNGQTNNGPDLLQRLQTQRQTGNIPLNIRAKVPVKLRLGKLKLDLQNNPKTNIIVGTKFYFTKFFFSGVNILCPDSIGLLQIFFPSPLSNSRKNYFTFCRFFSLVKNSLFLVIFKIFFSLIGCFHFIFVLFL